MYADFLVLTRKFPADSYYANLCYFYVEQVFFYYYHSYRRALQY